jgi:Zn-dependent protease with chaperone function
MPDASRPNRWRHPGVALLLPAALIALGLWQITRVAGSADDFSAQAGQMEASMKRLQPLATRDPGAVVHFNSNPQSYTAAQALGMMQSARTELRRDAVIQQARQVGAWTTAAGGAAALLAVLGCLAAASLGAWRGQRSRTALVGAFRVVVRVLPLLLGCVAVATALAVFAAVLFEIGGAWFMDGFGAGEIKLLLLGLVLAVSAVAFAVGSVRQLIRALAGWTPSPMQLLGRAAPPDAAPGLWAFLRQVAAGQGAAVPDNVVLGITQGFFVTSSAVLLLPEERVLTGRTLYLPTPLLPLLSRGEIAAVIAHELAHFVGEDTVYSQYFLPLYAGMSRSMDAVAARGRTSTWIDAVFQPAAVLAWHVMDTFSRTVAHWSRLRELEADRASLRVGDAQAAATALVRTGIGTDIIDGAMDDMYSRPDHADADLVATVVARAGASGFTEPARHLEDRQPHPTDSHPPTRQRIAALGIPIDDALLARASRPIQAEDGDFTAGLFTDWPSLRRTLGDDLLDIARSHDRELQTELEQAAGAVVADVPVHERARLVTVVFSVIGCLMALIGLFVGWVALGSDWTSKGDRPIILGVAAIALAAGGLALAVAWLRHRRGKAGPFLVVGSEGFRCIGLAAPVPWSAVDGVQVMTGQSFVTTFHLNATRPLPEQTGYRWSVKLDRRKRLLRLNGYVPQGMTAQAYLDLLNRGLRAFRAAALLRERAAVDTDLEGQALGAGGHTAHVSTSCSVVR